VRDSKKWSTHWKCADNVRRA
jgi:hypothetical protein